MKYTRLDERFAHQIPEPFPHVAQFHTNWRESLFFILHKRNEPGDVIIVTLAHYPAHREMDSHQLGRIGSDHVFAHHVREVDGDQDDFRVGPVTIDIVEPLKTIHLRAAPSEVTPVSFDIMFEARTKPYQLRRGTMKARHEVIWDQSHMFQSGTYNGTYTHDDITYEIDSWWGQRDHGWGIRTHPRIPLWMWTPIQLEEGFLQVWHWEYPNGARVYTDGCFAPADGGDPIPLIDFQHDLHWLDGQGHEASYGKYGEDVQGMAGLLHFTLQGGRKISIEGSGRWAQRYSGIKASRAKATIGGGLMEMQIRSSDGQAGTAIYEVTGQWHHRYFPIARGEGFPPDGHTPGADERA